MSKALPHQLMQARNDLGLVMDARNLAHRQSNRSLLIAACGAKGQLVTLAQAIAWGVGFCRSGACYPPVQGGNPHSTGRAR
jgi:hypothetical protein